MSRGPGRIERAIRALFDAHPDDTFTTDYLVKHCNPDEQARWQSSSPCHTKLAPAANALHRLRDLGLLTWGSFTNCTAGGCW
jgi:hypothetical protein